MKIKEIVSALERFAPLPLQDGFDNAGLQIGLTEAEATGALLCLDVTEAVLDEAIALGYNLVISHHPLIFKGYKSITGKDYVERCILKAIKNDIVIYSAHTNLDNAQGGVNYKIAEKIGLKNLKVLEPKENSLIKLVTFVPDAQADSVREALFAAGCGNIGNYDSCSYNLKGEGTFRAKEGTHPFCGTIGELHHENEVRIETILPVYKKAEVINLKAMSQTYRLMNMNHLKEAIDLISNCNNIYIFGVGASGLVAQDFQYKLSRIKRIAIYQKDSHTQLISAVNIEPNDIAIGISYSGETKEVNLALKKAKELGAKTIGITKFNNTLSKIVDISLHVPSEEKEIRVGAITSRISALVITDLLYLGVAKNNLKKTEEYILKTREFVKKIK